VTGLHLGTVKIPVSDLGVSVPFYCDCLGLRVLFEVRRYGWVQLEGARFGIALYELGKSDNAGPLGHDLDFHMTTDDPDGVLQRVRDRCPDAGWEVHVSGAYVLRLTDPDGNLLHIFAPGPDEDESLKTWPDSAVR